MNRVLTAISLLLMALAIASGITKIALVEQDVEFFGKYGFTHPILIAFGIAQLVGGVLLAIRKFRLAGAVIVAITFFVSLVVLLLEGSVAASCATLVALLLLGMLMKQSWNATAADVSKRS